MARLPIASQEFESLTHTLADWFDKNLNDLPIALRQRVARDFSPIPWDNLSADQRRSVALQWDNQNDPATEQDRQYWWDFFERMRELKAQITEWKSAATPTASDISLKESRLKELQQEMDRMELQQRQARGDYYPGRKGLDADKVSTPADYIAYPKALKILLAKWQATPEELAAWIFLGPETGGIAAYLNANELDPPPRFYFASCLSEDYLAPLMACWFRQDDIDRFEPADRYITGAALIERWSKQPGLRPEAFIRAKIAESRLLDVHPTFGSTQGTFDDDSSFPLMSAGLFAMSHVERIEDEDALDFAPIEPTSDAEPDKLDLVAEINKMPLTESIESHDGKYLFDETMLRRLVDAATTTHRVPLSNVKREARKLETQTMYKAWQKEYRSLLRKQPGKGDIWYSQKIAKMNIAKGRKGGTIRKQMKK